jgi:hypothetical protein
VSCKKKAAFDFPEDARRVIRTFKYTTTNAGKRPIRPRNVYLCQTCGRYHLTSGELRR